jgi:hypothetical protein
VPHSQKVALEYIASKYCLTSTTLKDQATAIITGHDPELFYPFFKYQILAGKLGGEIFVAEDTTKTLVGVGVWFGPGRAMFDK